MHTAYHLYLGPGQHFIAKHDNIFAERHTYIPTKGQKQRLQLVLHHFKSGLFPIELTKTIFSLVSFLDFRIARGLQVRSALLTFTLTPRQNWGLDQC